MISCGHFPPTHQGRECFCPGREFFARVGDYQAMCCIACVEACFFGCVAESCSAIGEKVTAPEQLMPALRRAFDALCSSMPVLLNVTTQNRG